MTQKLLSNEELLAKLDSIVPKCNESDCYTCGARHARMLDLINNQKRLYAEMAISLDAEALMRVGNKSDNHRSHVPAYKAIIEEQMARIK